MKKITLFLLSVVALASASKAQTPVNALDFTNNPDKYKGMTISISGLELNTSIKAPVSANVASGVTVSKGKGKTVANTVRCNAPKGYKVVNVNFPNDANFKKCFIMKNNLYSTLPINQSAIKATINFKVEPNFGYTITLFTL